MRAAPVSDRKRSRFQRDNAVWRNTGRVAPVVGPSLLLMGSVLIGLSWTCYGTADAHPIHQGSGPTQQGSGPTQQASGPTQQDTAQSQQYNGQSNLDPAPIEWLTGKEVDEAGGLAFSLRWTGMPLGERLRLMSARKRIAVFIDRRVDPSIPVTLELSNVTFEQFLWRLAETCDAAETSGNDVSSNPRNYGVCRVDDVYYFGPKQSAATLPVLLELLADETASKEGLKDGVWRKRGSIAWERLAQPASIIKQLCTDNSATLINTELLEHDLWPAVDLPPLKFEQRLALLLVGFNKIYRRSDDGTQIQLIEIPILANGPQKVTLTSAAKDIVKELRNQFPDYKIRASGRTIKLEGDIAIGYEIRRAIANMQVAVQGDEDSQRFSIDTASLPRPRGEMLATIANRMRLQLTFDPNVRSQLDEPVALTVMDKRLEEILAMVLAGSGLVHRVEGGNLVIEVEQAGD